MFFSVFIRDRRLHFLNLTRVNIAFWAEDSRALVEEARATPTPSPPNPLPSIASRLFAEWMQERAVTSQKLLRLLRDIAAFGPLKAVCDGDTAIGRSIEAALGIRMNAKKAPDYHGIELKAFRSTKPENGLITLFAKTPDWDRSLIKGSKDFLTRFGYNRGGERRLYCSVHATKYNSQGLRLNLNLTATDLEEYHESRRDQVLAVWAMDGLHSAFRKKHAETFWIAADTSRLTAGERFHLRSVTHTRQPIIPQFDSFIVDGEICLDHTIKQKGTGTKDHGYLFRVRQERFTELFSGLPQTYKLV